jgi:hypothetical protein
VAGFKITCHLSGRTDNKLITTEHNAKALAECNDFTLVPRGPPRLLFYKTRDVTRTRGQPRVEAGSNTSTEALRVVGGDEKGTQCLGV